MKGPLFYSKILLFGEYGIIKDSKGLAIPFNSYKGALKTSKNLTGEAKKSNENLMKFHEYLIGLKTELVAFDFEELNNDIDSLKTDNLRIVTAFSKNINNRMGAFVKKRSKDSSILKTNKE